MKTKQDIVEKIIATVMYPTNPDMSGDQRKRLSPPTLRRVEDTARAILEELGIENN